MERYVRFNIPEGYEIDHEKSTFGEIVFKKIDDSNKSKPKTWEEYCENNTWMGKWIITSDSVITVLSGDNIDANLNCKLDKNLVNSKEEADAFLALMQLRALRKAWVGDWEPNWEDEECKWYIYVLSNRAIEHSLTNHIMHTLTFPTQEMVKEFIECFKDLIGQAKILL